MDLKSLMEQAHATAKAKGWWETERPFLEQLMLMVSELSEAGEDYRVHGLSPDKFLRIESGKPEGIAVELADVLIRLGDTCEAYDIPLVEALEKKLAYNLTRPYRHNNKLA